MGRRIETTTKGVSSMALVVIAAVLATLTALLLSGGLGIDLPFTSEEVDRTPPVVVGDVRDIAEFRAAETDMEVIVDIENDVRFVPDIIAGERVQYVAVGSVAASVDFSQLSEDDIIYDEETGAVTIILPAPTIEEPVIDLDESGVMNRDRGLFNRLGSIFVDNPTSEEPLMRAAQEEMAAAAEDTSLIAEARENTERMLEELLGGVDVESVIVRFEVPASP